MGAACPILDRSSYIIAASNVSAVAIASTPGQKARQIYASLAICLDVLGSDQLTGQLCAADTTDTLLHHALIQSPVVCPDLT